MSAVYLALTALAFYLGGPLAARLGALRPFHGFLTFALSGPFALLAILLGAWLGARGDRFGWLALALALIPLATLGMGVAAGRKVPPINDVSTDLEDPPVFVAAKTAVDNIGKDLSFPAEFREPVRSAYADLRPLSLTRSPEAAFSQVEQQIAGRPGWRIRHRDPQAGVIEAEVTSGLFRFVDDLVVRVRAAGEGSRVDVRSRSRVGRSDFGANAARIRELLAALTPS